MSGIIAAIHRMVVQKVLKNGPKTYKNDQKVLIMLEQIQISLRIH